jgi:hypothetical protein
LYNTDIFNFTFLKHATHPNALKQNAVFKTCNNEDAVAPGKPISGKEIAACLKSTKALFAVLVPATRAPRRGQSISSIGGFALGFVGFAAPCTQAQPGNTIARLCSDFVAAVESAVEELALQKRRNAAVSTSDLALSQDKGSAEWVERVRRVLAEYDLGTALD